MLPVVWLLGTSGVGKSTVGYRVLSELDAAGVTAAFVDADQLRLAAGVPVPETDLIASALPELDRGYRAHGARALIVAGLADDRDHLARLLPGVPRERVLGVHLDADGDTIRERVHRRGWLTDLADSAVDYATRIAPDVADLRLDTTGRSPAELAVQVTAAARTHIRQAASETGEAPPVNVTTPRHVVVITGPGGSGVSTVAYRTFSLLAATGEPVGYVDAHQVGFLGADVRGDRLAPLRATNARAVAGCLARGGAQTVVVSGDPRTVRLLVDAEDEVTAFWLHASEAALAERIAARARGGGPVIQGDHRIGLTGPALADAIAAAVRESRQRDLRPERARPVDTSDLDPAQVAETIVASPAVAAATRQG